MPTYNTRKARKIIRHLKRYGLDGVAAKALAKCGSFQPLHIAKDTPSYIKDMAKRTKREAKAKRRYDRAEAIYDLANESDPKDTSAMAWAIADSAKARPYLSL